MTSILRFLAGLSLVGGALSVGACGDDDSSGDASTGGSATGGKVAGGAPTGGAAPSGGTGGSTGGRAPTGGASTGGIGGSGGDAGGVDSGGSDSGGSAGDGVGGEGGDAGGDTGGFAGVPSEPSGEPLLERPVNDGYACELSEPLVQLELPWAGAAFVGGDSPVLFWSEPESAKIVGASFADGELGTPYTIRDTEGGVAPPSVARNGARITLAWPEFDYSGPETEYSLMIAQVDANGAVLTAAHALPGTQGEPGSVEITAAGDGYGLVWREGTATTNTLKFVRLDAEGAPLGTPKVLAEAQTIQLSDLLALEDGFAVAFGQWVNDAYGVYYLGLDAEGSPYRAPVPLGQWDAALTRRGDRVLAAWTHRSGDLSGDIDARYAVNLRLGWFDERGRPVGETYDLQAPELDRENVHPAWVDFGDDLGLAWSHGSVIYICAGCIPDNHVEFVVLDGETLEPKSEVVSIENALTNGGLMSSSLAASGNDVTVVTSITYHTSAEGASAAIACTP